MADYIFEDMTAEDAEAFEAGDTLRFSSASATPANVTFSNNGLNNTSVTSGTKTLSFEGPALAGGDIEFTSSFLAGTATTAFVGTNTGDTIGIGNADGGNYAYGFAGDDSISGGDGGDNIFGGAGGDRIIGGDEGDHIYGFGFGSGASADGDDSVDGGNGNDYIQGNAGADTLNGGDGRDRINGGADNDVIDGDDGHDTVNGNKGDDSISGGDGNDSLRGGQDNDVINGGSDNDLIQGDLGDDNLDGDSGNDLVSGGDGNDVVDGDSGDDILGGDAGDDVITGGTGFDTSTGGAGDDTFTFAAGDATIGTLDERAFVAVETVSDFANDEDLIDLGFTVDLITPAVGVIFTDEEAARDYAVDQTLTAGDVLALTVGDDTFLYYEGAGTGATANAVIKLVGVDAADVDVDDFVA